jgi:hypothetical protein
VTVNVETLLDSIRDDATSLNEEQIFTLLRMVHIALRQVRLSYELGIETGNEMIDLLINGIGAELESCELEIAEQRHEK